MRYSCAICGTDHVSMPLCFGAPSPWREMGVAESEYSKRVEENDDLCVVDSEHYFIRGHIEISIHERDDVFCWSVWCSLSDASFAHVQSRWNDPERAGDGYFGWLCAALPCYPTSTIHLKTNVLSREVGCVPLIEIQECDHPLYEEQRNGMSERRWHAIVHELMDSPD